MLQRIKNYFNKEYSKAQARNKKVGRISMPSAAGRLLIMFFLAMFVFTFVSRVAASITVAKVSVSSPKRDRLLYSISGIGEIAPISEEGIQVEPGYRITDVYVSVGDKVSKDSALFSYNLQSLQDKYDALKNDIDKINLQISIEKLRLEPAGSILSKPSLLSLKQAKENLEVAKNNLIEAEREYNISMSSSEIKEKESWQKEYENRQMKYNTSLKNYESIVFQQEKQLKLSGRSVDDAKDALLKSNEKYGEINPLIDKYLEAIESKDEGAIYRTGEAVYETYYGGAEAYEDHREAIFNIALAIQEEDYYLWYLKNQILHYDEVIYTILSDLQKVESSVESSVDLSQTKENLLKRYNLEWENYSRILNEYDKQLVNIESGLDRGSSELKKLRRDDRKLKDYLAKVRIAYEEKTDMEIPQKDLVDFIMGDRTKEIEDEISRLTLVLTRAEEDYDFLKKEFDMVREDLKLELTELKDDIIGMENEIYDFSDTLEGKRQTLKSAEEAVRIAEQVVETAKLHYEEARKADNNQNTTQITELNIQGHNIDLHKIDKELEEVSTLIESSGVVLSPYEGIITEIGLEVGRSTTGDEIIKIGRGDYVFRGAFIKDENINIELGGNVNISLAGKAKPIESQIGIISTNNEGMTEFISSLPQGEDYYLGEKAEFKISTESEQYDQCIPIQAIREDNYGYYVLVIGVQEDILGTQIIAERRNVDLLAKGISVVAVDGYLSKSQIIIDSNKYISAGDRVRID